MACAMSGRVNPTSRSKTISRKSLPPCHWQAHSSLEKHLRLVGTLARKTTIAGAPHIRLIIAGKRERGGSEMVDEIGKGGTEPRSLPQLALAAVGMTVVAFVCALAGLFYGFRQLPPFGLIFYVGWFGLLVFPYYFSREGSVEEPLHSTRDRKNNIFVPLVIFTLVAALAISVAKNLSVTESELWGKHVYDGLIFLMVMALAPFWYIGIHTLWLLNKSEEAARHERAFKNKVLLPAFATCLVSFNFGWTISHPRVAWWTMVIPIIIVVTLKTFSSRRGGPSLKFLIFFILLCLIAAFVPVIIWNSEAGTAIIIGIILTFAMGVAEVCKRVVRIPVENRNSATTDGEDFWFYFAGSNWSSVVFPLLLCFLPLFIYELPILPIVVILAMQYVHWHYFFPKKTSRALFWINTVLGFLLPTALCLQYVYPLPPMVIRLETAGDLMTVFGLAIAFVVGVITLKYSDQARTFLGEWSNPQSYERYDNCFFLFAAGVCVVVILIFALAATFDAFIGSHAYRQKATETAIYLLILIVGVGFTWSNRRDYLIKNEPRRTQSDETTPSHSRADLPMRWWSQPLLLIFNVGRLPVGLIAAVGVCFIEGLYTSNSWGLLFIHALPICLVTMAGFVMNDIFDIEKDRMAGRPKLVAIGIVPIRSAKMFAWLLSFAALFIAILVSRGLSVAVINFALLGVLAYSAVAKYVPTAKGLVTAILCCAPFAYAAELSAIHFPLQLYLFLIVFIVGRELLLDVRDFYGDLASGIRTLAWHLGLSVSRIVGWILMFASLIVGIWYANGFGEYLFVAALASLIFCSWLYTRNEDLGLGWSRMTLLIGAVAVAFSL
jgi:4-hydroxybenzoate polyprenyltransferase